MPPTLRMLAFRNAMAEAFFGMSVTNAHMRNVCVCCKKSVDTLKMAREDYKEYTVSALCPECWTKIIAGIPVTPVAPDGQN